MCTKFHLDPTCSNDIQFQEILLYLFASMQILPEHIRWSMFYVGVRVAQSLFLCVVFCRSIFILLYILLMAMILSYPSWLPVWYLRDFTDNIYMYIQEQELPLYHCLANRV
jgi:hypothetical protein